MPIKAMKVTTVRKVKVKIDKSESEHAEFARSLLSFYFIFHSFVQIVDYLFILGNGVQDTRVFNLL